MQSALTQPADSIKAVIGFYPQLDIRDPFFNTWFEKVLLGMPMAFLPSRLDVPYSMMQNRAVEFLEERKEGFPVELVALAETMPAVLIMHGSDDSVVSVAGSERFVYALKKKLPGNPVRLYVRPGDHGFDGDATIKEEWLKKDMEFITRYWLG